ncbi:MAG: TIGR04190 family B12-binding domain/radical SAM domain protein [Thermoplasmata archaeon]
MYDLVLIHPPSIYNFRDKLRDYGPVSDMVPSTPIFEMYPLGFLSILSNLCPLGYKVKIENIALEMLKDKSFNVKKRIESLDSAVFGIDLHWLPHVHGAISIAKEIKKIWPDRKIIFGGISSSYYHLEIMKNCDFVDAVMLGDTTEPFLSGYIDSVISGKKPENVPNIVWRNDHGIKINNILSPEKYIDKVNFDYSTILKNCIKDLEILPYLPYSGWINSPTAMTIIQKGCHNNCLMCGGSCYAYKNFFFRKRVSLRPIKNVINDLISIKEHLGIPVYISGDIYQAGEKYREELLREMRENDIDLPILLELFYPAPEKFYEIVEKNISYYAIEISPESSVEEIRIKNNKFYTNYALDKNIEFAKKHNAKKMDIFFSIGLSGQGRLDVFDDYIYSKRRKDKYGDWIHFFTSPIVPFLDPGSIAFEMSDKYGYRIFARTLMEHYYLLENSTSWVNSLNYETLWLSREQMGKISIEMQKLFSSLSENYRKDDLYWTKKFKIKFPYNIILKMHNLFIAK